MSAPALPRLGICHAPDGAANLREVFRAARDLCVPVILVDARVAAAHPDLVALASRILECHVLPESDVPEAVADLVTGLGLAGVTTFHDDELERADALDRLVRRAPAPAVAAPWDKLVQRQVLHAAGLSAVRAEAVDSPEELHRAYAALGGSCVLKPRRAAGGRGIAFLDGWDDIAAHVAARRVWDGMLLETRIPAAPHPSGTPWLGSLISVETVSAGSRRVHLGVLDKLPVAVGRHEGPDGTDAVNVQGDILPSALPAGLLDRARELTGRVLDALEVRDRVTHTELLLTPAGLEVMEVNGRLAGHTARLFRLVGAPDPVRTALAAALGGEPNTTAAPEGTAAGLFPTFRDRTGTVRTQLRPRDLRELPGVQAVDELARDGEEKAALQYRMANLTVRADDRPGLDHAVTRVLATLTEGFADPAGIPDTHPDASAAAAPGPDTTKEQPRCV
ncbi:ATP-grasp domain-containing protein [Streptomyces sp. NBC_01335]|uniref:ATP-grasp domain-containing protein n=1 Tax=Streptomyces sp. NBC_01335 TaxID=2903828 RepID=UPI002E121327|nr:ATP-grasp domain-containing protein [Streptomyces sp. NBC_01335]